MAKKAKRALWSKKPILIDFVFVARFGMHDKLARLSALKDTTFKTTFIQVLHAQTRC